MERLAIAIFLISMTACACGGSRDSSTEAPAETSEVVEQEPRPITEQPAADQETVSPRIAPEVEVVATSETDYIEMLRPGVISRYDKIVRKYARRYLFDWRLISAQIYTESRFRHQARSYRGALGLMQIMPGTAQWLEGKAGNDAPELRGVSQMLLDPEMNIHLGCYYDAMLLGRAKNTESRDDRHKMMFAAYNAGPGNLSRARRKSSASRRWEDIKRYLPAETRKYVPTIYSRYEVYKQWAALKPY